MGSSICDIAAERNSGVFVCENTIKTLAFNSNVAEGKLYDLELQDGTIATFVINGNDIISVNLNNVPNDSTPINHIIKNIVELLNKQAILDLGLNAANEAQASAAEALTYKDSAESAYDSFLGTYYGAFSSDPTEDPLGNPIDEGDMYTNTVTGVLRIYIGTSWVDTGSNVQGLVERYEFEASAGQTLFSGLSYDVNYINVYRQGRMLPTDSYVATNGTSVTLNDPASLNDDIIIEAIGLFNTANLNSIVSDILANTSNISDNSSDILDLQNNVAYKNQNNSFTVGQDFNGTENSKFAGNLGIGNGTEFGGGTECLSISYSNTPPSSDPTEAIVIYAENGIMKIRNPSGLVISVGDSLPNFSYRKINFPLEVFDAQQMLIQGELEINSNLKIDGSLSFIN